MDRVNKRFKLPRTKFNFVGLRDAVGKYVVAGLPNITAYVNFPKTLANEAGGAMYLTDYGNNNQAQHTGTGSQINFDASLSSSIYGNSNTVQPPATQMYLYFYVGQFSQTATEQTAGLNSSLFNGKVDLDLNNMNASAASKETIIGWVMPDYTSSTTLASGDTAPANGYLYVVSGGSRVFSILIDNVTAYTYNWSSGYGSPDNCYIPVAKGSVVTTTDSSSVSFVPCVGG